MNARIIAALAALAASPAAAQQPDLPAESTMARGHAAWFFAIGTQRAEWGNVDDAFAAAGGYPALPKDLLQIGGGVYFVGDRFLVGGEGHGTLSPRMSQGGRETRIDGGGGYVTLGFVLVDAPRARLYPMVGLGGTAMQIRIEQSAGTGLGPDVNNPSFGQVLNDPGQRSRLTNGAFAISAGVGLDLMPVSWSRRTGGRGGPMIGVRAGWQWALYAGDWKMYDQRIIGGPDELLGGFYVRASIGGAGTFTPRHRRR